MGTLREFTAKNILQSNGDQPTNITKKSDDSSSWGLLNWLSVALISFGIIIVLIFGASLSAKATIFIWMLACLLAGTAVGFLFGIPKILQNNQAAGNAPAYQQQVNTNLTEISDWLTKIIVGLGLVSLTKIPPHLSTVAKILAGGLTKSATSPTPLAFAFAYGSIIAYVILGFLFGYITTRLYIALEFYKADRKTLPQQVVEKMNDATGAAESALRKLDFALIPDQASQQNADPRIALQDLAKKYVQTRTSMDSGKPRTQKMAAIFKEMTAIAPKVAGDDIPALLKETDIGKRLIGYAHLYTKPDVQYLDHLIEAIASDTTPFGQYWSIQALGKMVDATPGIQIKPESFQKLKAYYDKLPKGIDREYELRKIIPSLKG